MEDKLVFLTSASEATKDLIVQQLQDARIKYEVREETSNFVFGLYGGYKPVGNKIYVPESEVQRARELLSIKEEVAAPASQFKFPLVFKVLAIILALYFIFLIVMQLIVAIGINL